MAPEQIRGEQAGPAADVYALAGVLCHCLTGQVPFPRDNEAAALWAHVNAPPPTISRLRPGLPPAIDEVVARGMAKEPAQRFAGAGELARACAGALGVPGMAVPVAATERESATAVPSPAPTVLSE
jgi:serine/threonine protein kinase